MVIVVLITESCDGWQVPGAREKKELVVNLFLRHLPPALNVQPQPDPCLL
jgi:hypothetical protein